VAAVLVSLNGICYANYIAVQHIDVTLCVIYTRSMCLSRSYNETEATGSWQHVQRDDCFTVSRTKCRI